MLSGTAARSRPVSRATVVNLFMIRLLASATLWRAAVAAAFFLFYLKRKKKSGGNRRTPKALLRGAALPVFRLERRGGQTDLVGQIRPSGVAPPETHLL